MFEDAQTVEEWRTLGFHPVLNEYEDDPNAIQHANLIWRMLKIYEHLILSHLYFADLEDRQFFRIVRSSTPPGRPIDLIATRRPYDDPGVSRVYYRLTPEMSTIFAKTHMPYALTAERRANWQAWFRDAEYEAIENASYEPEIASNPFRSFDPIPVRSRYRFLLDEARKTIRAWSGTSHRLPG